MQSVASVLTLLVSLSTVLAAQEPARALRVRPILLPERGVVLPVPAATRLLTYLPEARGWRTIWAPTRADIDGLERQLTPALDTALACLDGDPIAVEDYYRQYVAFADATGRRRIVI